MEISLKEEKPKQTICLNMIVKNEAHIIKDTLTKLTAKVKFDYWVISDTGSTDNTAEIIIDFFKEKNILGELYHDEWKDFGHNRTLALSHAYKKSDYLFIFDADDEIFGEFRYPDFMNQDAYKLIFGNSHTYSYERPLLINNQRKWQYLGVLHEYLDPCGIPATMQTICGNYSVLSGRTGNRSSDPEKYLKDALVLEKAYYHQVEIKGDMQDRYAFYCANSFFDYGSYDKAAEWYKITLTQTGWDQEKYIACLKLYKCYKRLGQLEVSHFYLVKSHYYDKERSECIYKLVVHYCCENQNEIAYNFYSLIREYCENKYILDNTCNKLFVDNRVSNFYLPYYVIIISERTKHYDSGIKMFQTIFLKKLEGVAQQHVGNLLFNFRFFRGFLNDLNKEIPEYVSHFYELFNDYVAFLISRGFNLAQYEYFAEYKDFLHPDLKKIILKPEVLIEAPKPVVASSFNEDDCKNSKNVLIFGGFCDKEWNYTFGLNNALGGSERAVNYIASSFPKDYNIIVSGSVKEETIGNVKYVHLFKLNELFKTTCFHTVIVSRYISFYEMFKNVSMYKSYIWVHDTSLSKYGCGIEPTQILEKWNKRITGTVCLTQWHATHIENLYPILKNKIHIINNGITPSLFHSADAVVPFTQFNQKVKNLFVYSSCSERGLARLLELWPGIIELLPDAQLKIASYNAFPTNDNDARMKVVIDAHPNSIKHCGKLNPNELYQLMAQAEYWLYPSNWPETSCITALEMLYSGVICMYYPCAGLVDTMDKYGFKIQPGGEIDVLKRVSSLSKEEKDKIRADCHAYSASCSWDNRAQMWTKLLFN